jgi:cytochrome c nitrite reductase small subunit
MGSTNRSWFKKFFLHTTPPKQWKYPVIILLGIFSGLGLYVLHISNALSYLSDNPKTCVNCHVMYPQYATWERGSHSRGVTCNDCHVPQNNFIEKYLFKATDGLRHATYFTMRWEPQVIQIKDAGKRAVQDNCIRCHSNLIHPLSLRPINNKNVEDQTDRYCWDCHRETPHGRVHSLSSTPYARVPQLKPTVPDWLEKFILSENKN